MSVALIRPLVCLGQEILGVGKLCLHAQRSRRSSIIQQSIRAENSPPNGNGGDNPSSVRNHSHLCKQASVERLRGGSFTQAGVPV